MCKPILHIKSFCFVPNSRVEFNWKRRCQLASFPVDQLNIHRRLRTEALNQNPNQNQRSELWPGQNDPKMAILSRILVSGGVYLFAGH